MARNKTSVATDSDDATIPIATTETIATAKKQAWNYQPVLPIALSPYFDFPSYPKAMWRWFMGTWFKITPPVNHLFFTLLAYAYFWPPVSAMQQPHWHWILQNWLVDMAAVLVLATPLHLYLYPFSGQQLR